MVGRIYEILQRRRGVPDKKRQEREKEREMRRAERAMELMKKKEERARRRLELKEAREKEKRRSTIMSRRMNLKTVEKVIAIMNIKVSICLKQIKLM